MSEQTPNTTVHLWDLSLRLPDPSQHLSLEPATDTPKPVGSTRDARAQPWRVERLRTFRSPDPKAQRAACTADLTRARRAGERSCSSPLILTWRMPLPVPSSKPSGSGSVAPLAK